MKRLWIAQRLKFLNKKKGYLAIRLGLPGPRITDIIQGKRKIQAHEIPTLSAFLELDSSIILENIQKETPTQFPQDTPRTETIKVVGHFAKLENIYDLWPSSKHYTITLPLHSTFPGVEKFALEETQLTAPQIVLHICVFECDCQPDTNARFKKIYPTNENIRTAQAVAVANHPPADQSCRHAEALIIAKYQQS
jgi:plasmid maintenance system antidote protein VapI